MKPVKKTKSYLFILLLVGLLFASCQKDDVLDPEPQPNPNLNIDANKVTQSLKFRNGTIISGDIPKSANSKNAKVVADLKMSVDTIFWVEGIINRIRILKPASVPGFSGSTFWAQVEGSDSYIEAEFEIEQENDTLVFLNFDFDVTEWEPPFSFNINFVPSDDTGTEPIDVFKRPVVIEKPNDGNCGFPYDTSWEWNATYVDGIYHSGPGDSVDTEGGVIGCCDDDFNSYYGVLCDPNGPYSVSLNYESSLMIKWYSFFFEEDKDEISGIGWEYANNLDIAGTDFCAQSVAYVSNDKRSQVKADVSLSNCTFTLENTYTFSDGFIFMGTGPNVEYTILSKHAVKETWLGGLDGPNNGNPALERFYISWHSDGQIPLWFD